MAYIHTPYGLQQWINEIKVYLQVFFHANCYQIYLKQQKNFFPSNRREFILMTILYRLERKIENQIGKFVVLH